MGFIKIEIQKMAMLMIVKNVEIAGLVQLIGKLKKAAPPGGKGICAVAVRQKVKPYFLKRVRSINRAQGENSLHGRDICSKIMA